MDPFAWLYVSDEASAVIAGSEHGTRYLAGGTTLVDLMKQGVERPHTIVDLTKLALTVIERTPSGGLRIGALATNTAVAVHAEVTARYPLLAQAILAGASPQIRNMATVAGNLLQRTRCPYFRDTSRECNKRERGAGCSARGGFDRTLAVIGTSEHCLATHASDMCVALVALDAIVHTLGPHGARVIAVRDFHTLPGDTPDVENLLGPGELVTYVELPASAAGARSSYVKVRDRASFAFALASAGVALEVDGVVKRARVVLGGVATKPWRSEAAETALVGKTPSAALFERAASIAMNGATPGKHNAFKIDLGKVTVARALSQASGVT